MIYPKISVIMPCYNHEKYVAYSIESVLNQTYPNIEFIVLDNGSTDESYDVIKTYENKITKVLHIDKNDLLECCEILRQNATGDYIANMTSDDYWAPDKLEKQVQIMKSDTSIKACFTWATMVDEEYNTIYEANKNIFAEKNRTREEWIERLLFRGNCLSYASSLVERKAYFEAAEQGPLYYQLGDKWMWLCVLLNGNIHVIEEPLTYMLWHPESKTANMSSVTLDSCVRTCNEGEDITVSFLQKMSDELFKSTFQKYFRDEKANNHQQLLCEKFFLLMKLAEKSPGMEQFVISFYYKNNEWSWQSGFKIAKALQEYYQYSYMDFQKYSATHGSGIREAEKQQQLKENKDAELKDIYRTALHDTLLEDILPEEREKKYREKVYVRLDEETKSIFKVLCDFLDKIIYILQKSICEDVSEQQIDALCANIKMAANTFIQIWDACLKYDGKISQEEWNENIKILSENGHDLEKFCEKTTPFLFELQKILHDYKG